MRLSTEEPPCVWVFFFFFYCVSVLFYFLDSLLSACFPLIWKYLIKRKYQKKKSKNIVYCIMCQSCNRLYIGETGKTLLMRLKQHLYNIGEGRLTTPLVKHFQVHSPQHLSIMGVQTGATWMVGQRRRRLERRRKGCGLTNWEGKSPLPSTSPKNREKESS